MTDDRKILLEFIASLTLCDHMGDVGDDIDTVLKRIGFVGPTSVNGNEDYLVEVRALLHKEGIRTLYGNPLVEGEK